MTFLNPGDGINRISEGIEICLRMHPRFLWIDIFTFSFLFHRKFLTLSLCPIDD